MDKEGPNKAGRGNQVLTKERQRQRGRDTQGQERDRQTEAEREIKRERQRIFCELSSSCFTAPKD